MRGVGLNVVRRALRRPAEAADSPHGRVWRPAALTVIGALVGAPALAVIIWTDEELASVERTVLATVAAVLILWCTLRPKVVVGNGHLSSRNLVYWQSVALVHVYSGEARLLGAKFVVRPRRDGAVREGFVPDETLTARAMTQQRLAKRIGMKTRADSDVKEILARARRARNEQRRH